PLLEPLRGPPLPPPAEADRVPPPQRRPCRPREMRQRRAAPPEALAAAARHTTRRPRPAAPGSPCPHRPGQPCLASARLISRPTSTTTPPVAGFTRIESQSVRVFSASC